MVKQKSVFSRSRMVDVLLLQEKTDFDCVIKNLFFCNRESGFRSSYLPEND